MEINLDLGNALAQRANGSFLRVRNCSGASANAQINLREWRSLRLDESKGRQWGQEQSEDPNPKSPITKKSPIPNLQKPWTKRLKGMPFGTRFLEIWDWGFFWDWGFGIWIFTLLLSPLSAFAFVQPQSPPLPEIDLRVRTGAGAISDAQKAAVGSLRERVPRSE